MYGPSYEAKLVEMFAQFKAACDVYSKVGGAFAFALVADMATWLFYLASAALFSNGYASTSFAEIMTQSLLVVLILFTVAEVGHQIACQVFAQDFRRGG